MRYFDIILLKDDDDDNGEACSITLHVNCKIAVFQECSSTYHGKDEHKG